MEKLTSNALRGIYSQKQQRLFSSLAELTGQKWISLTDQKRNFQILLALKSDYLIGALKQKTGRI